MTLLVATDDPGLVVLPTHRMVNPRLPAARSSGVSIVLSPEFARHFTAEPLSADGPPSAALPSLLEEMARRASEGPVFGAFNLVPGRLSIVRPRSRPVAPSVSRALDISVLHETLLEGVFGLSDADAEDADLVAYTRDAEAAMRAVEAGRYQLALFVNPTPIDRVLAVARAGEVMPRKSTYFHPKPRTGLVLYSLADRLPR
jgi:hypothetical protein